MTEAPDSCPTGCTIQQAVRWASQRLRAIGNAGSDAVGGIDQPRLEAELLLAHLLGTRRIDLHLRADEPLSEEAAHAYAALVQRRMAHEPLAYILGHRAFYDLDLIVTPDVLAPRPETEHLVEEILCYLGAPSASSASADNAELALGVPSRILDVGTGSGAIATIVARHLPQARVWAVDISWAALGVARQNVRLAGVQQRVQLVQGDLLAPFGGCFDVVAANLPYIAAAELPELMPEVARYEPRLALDGGAEGLEVIRRFLDQVAPHLGQPGLLLLEIDPRQSQRVLTLARERLDGPTTLFSAIKDYAGHDRIVRVERKRPRS
jgi:release factor glutamine methyltransferase